MLTCVSHGAELGTACVMGLEGRFWDTVNFVVPVHSKVGPFLSHDLQRVKERVGR